MLPGLWTPLIPCASQSSGPEKSQSSAAETTVTTWISVKVNMMKLLQPLSSQKVREHHMTLVLSAVDELSPIYAYQSSLLLKWVAQLTYYFLLSFLFLKTLKRTLCAAMAHRMSHHLAAASTTGVPIRSTLFLGNRAYGSAAVAVYEDYSEDEYVETLREPRLGTEKSVPGRGVQWVIMGDKSAKKHLFAERLSKLLEVPHISMGSLVRQELNPRSSLYKKVRIFILSIINLVESCSQ